MIVATVAGQDMRHPIERLGVCRIGRSQHSNIVLTDAAASRDHAMVRRDAAGACTLNDLGSPNGTNDNGRPVTATPVRLHHGDIIRIGAQELRFEDPQELHAGEAAEQPAEQATQFFLANSLITVLVLDIRGYTPLSRALGEERTSALMSEIFQRAGELLYKSRSWSQKYIGDAVMGVWVHSGPQVTVAELTGILDVYSEMKRFFEDLEARTELPQPLSFGAGINTGYASIGNMGSATVSDFTAMGDTVNKAFRLEGVTRALNCDMVVGQSVLDFLVPPLPLDQRPEAIEVEIKGYDKPERAISLHDAELPKFAALVASPRREATLIHRE
jgi:adenylate cyclase